MTVHAADRLVERAVAVVVLAALSLAFLCGEQEGDNRTEAVWKSSCELADIASTAWGGRTF